jgi:hypothetical protein
MTERYLESEWVQLIIRAKEFFNMVDESKTEEMALLPTERAPETLRPAQMSFADTYRALAVLLGSRSPGDVDGAWKLEVSAWDSGPDRVHWELWFARVNRHVQANTPEQLLAMVRAILDTLHAPKTEIENVGDVSDAGIV